MKDSVRISCVVLAFLTTVATFGCSGSDGSNGGGDNSDDTQKKLDAAEQAHAKYTDISEALADGYGGRAIFATNPEGEGAMGIHLVNPSIQGIDHEAANVLVYTLDDAGNYELAGIEWFVPAENFGEAPTLFGQTFKGPMPGHEEGQPKHYELHAWLFKENPNGKFATWNTGIEPPSYAGDLNKLAEAVHDYQDVSKAKNAGYKKEGGCAVHPEDQSMGAMGIHYLNKNIMGLDPTKPNVLVYEPTGDGKQLVAAEWFVPADQFDEAPTLFGQTFKGPMPGHEEGQPEHYELHVWVGKPNPNGLFAQWNPAVTCPDGGESK